MLFPDCDHPPRDDILGLPAQCKSEKKKKKKICVTLPCEWDLPGFSRLMTSLHCLRRQTTYFGFDTRFDRWKDDLMEETDTKSQTPTPPRYIRPARIFLY